MPNTTNKYAVITMIGSRFWFMSFIDMNGNRFTDWRGRVIVHAFHNN